MKDRFEHILHEKLHGHSEIPERGDWALLERRLGLDAPKRRAVPLWRKVTAAAAVALLVGLGGLALWNRAPEPLIEVAKTAEIPTQIFAEPPASDGRAESEALTAVRNLKKAIERSVPALVQIVPPSEAAYEAAIPAIVPQEDRPENKDVTRGVSTEPSRRYVAAATPSRRPQRVPRTPNGNWALSLFAGGMGGGRPVAPSTEGMLMALNTGRTETSMVSDAPARGSSDYLIQYDPSRNAGLLSVEVAEWEHARPIGGGFRLRRGLTERWGVEAGLQYTYLSSKQQTSNVLRRQELHYLGIPLAVTFTPLRTRSFELYARAGGAADLNIAGRTRLKTNGVQAPVQRFTAGGIQWSASANLGAMVRITPALGLYLEPGVSHRFEFSGQPESYWKEHPTAFEVQVGIRADF